jgi:hypothetical protein
MLNAHGFASSSCDAAPINGFWDGADDAELLRDGPRSVEDLVDRLGLRQPQVSKHLRVLSDAGLVGVPVNA